MVDRFGSIILWHCWQRFMLASRTFLSYTIFGLLANPESSPGAAAGCD
jgi:hypothetical protein